MRNWLDMLNDEELEAMKPYGLQFIQEQFYLPHTITSVPFPTDAYVREKRKGVRRREKASFSI